MLYPLYCFDLGTKYTKIMQTKKNLIDKAQFQYFLFFFIFFFYWHMMGESSHNKYTALPSLKSSVESEV